MSLKRLGRLSQIRRKSSPARPVKLVAYTRRNSSFTDGGSRRFPAHVLPHDVRKANSFIENRIEAHDPRAGIVVAQKRSFPRCLLHHFGN